MNNHKDSIFSKYIDDSPESVELRRICAKINSLKPSHSLKNILITSAISGEGKSTMATLLAITFARYQTGNILLMDCDLRRPQIYKNVDLENRIGIADILKGKIRSSEAVKNTPIENLKIITSGYSDESPSKLIKSSLMKNIILELNANYNFKTIILDSPPVIPVSDSLILSNIADMTLLIIKAGKTQKEVVNRAVALLKDVNTQKLAVIVNNLKNILPYYYNYKYYRYKYTPKNHKTKVHVS